jgi:glutathionylspermidine synthase
LQLSLRKTLAWTLLEAAKEDAVADAKNSHNSLLAQAQEQFYIFRTGGGNQSARLAVSKIDINDMQTVTALARAAEMTIAQVRNAIRLAGGEEADVRNYLQKCVFRVQRSKSRKPLPIPPNQLHA